MGSPRRRGREIALQILFVIDANPNLSPEQATALFYQHLASNDDQETEGLPAKDEPTDKAYAERLVREVTARRNELDQTLSTVSRNWRVERMARVDRNVLRLALYELTAEPEIPARVSINEAIELAKRFGSAEAPGFVNGILDAAVKGLSIGK